MKLKNVNLSFLILIGLMFLSFALFVVAQEQGSMTNNVFLDSDQDGLTDDEEKTYGTNPRKADTDGDGYTDGAEVKSGYDPKKPAPGDKIVASTNQNKTETVLGQDNSKNEENLTQKVSQKISELTTNMNEEDQSITVDKIKSIVDESISSNNLDNIPEIKDSDIKIKKQDYGKISKEKAKEKRKEDFINYITAVFYIISSNSPSPLTSATDISSVLMQITQKITNAMISRNASPLDDLEKSGEKVLEQLKEIEVPEEMVETHKKALIYAMYSQKLKNYINSNPEDPIEDISNFSKIEALISNLSQFSTEIEAKFTEYDIDYDDTIKNKIKSLGIDPPEIDEVVLNEITSSLSSDNPSSD